MTKISADGTAWEYSTFLGGQNEERGRGIAVNDTGQAYVTGYTKSETDFPVVNALQANSGGNLDAFVAKLSVDGSTLEYATYFGGAKEDLGHGIALNQAGDIYIVGSTLSDTGFPVVDAPQSNLAGDFDAFVAKLSQDGSAIRYSTYLGGSSPDQGHAIALDQAGNAYVTGFTESQNDFPLQGAAQPLFGGDSQDGFLAKIGDNAVPVITSSPVTTAELGVPYSYDVEASDPDDDPLTFSLTVFPDGMQIDSSSGLIGWTPDVLGDFEVIVAVDDGQGAVVTQNYTATVADTTPPVITVITPADGSLTNNPSIDVEGQVNEPASLTLNGASVTLDANQAFTHPLTLNEGGNTLSLAATDTANNDSRLY